MDIGTIVGLILGSAMIIMAMAGTGVGLGQYIDIPSVLMVFGGSFAAVMISNPLTRVLSMPKYLSHVFKVPNYDLKQTISTLTTFSGRARREGLLALEDDVEEVEEDFLRNGIQLVVDGTDPEIIKSILFNDLSQLEARHEQGISIFDTWGKLAPAFGMIGTLAGLIGMLAALEDPDAIGAGMALALITTMYGAIMANLVLIPIKNKLEDRDKEEQLLREIMIEGILSIQAGDNPKILEYKLLSFVDPVRRKELEAELANE